jgi:hypothetical protein
MFTIVPAYNTSNESETRIINVSQIEQIQPNPDVFVDPGAVPTSCCLATFFSGTTMIILLDFGTMQEHLQALTGVIDEFGSLL